MAIQYLKQPNSDPGAHIATPYGDRRLSPADSPELAGLINYIRDRRCVLFVGAGLSRAAGLPSWNELIHHLVEPSVRMSSAESAEGELSSLLQEGKYTELAGHCRELLGSHEFYSIVRRELVPRGDIPEIYRSIVSTPFACIVTTNFDTLLEDAYARWDARGIPKTPTGADLAQQGTLLLDGAFFILKAHGDLADAQGMIFTAEDYRRVIHSNPAFQTVLSSILLTHAVLFIGYSLKDPNFRLLLDSQLTIFNEEVPPRYALMSDIGKVEQEILWRTARVRVLPYPKGQREEVGRFLQAVSERAGQRALPADSSSTLSQPAAAVVGQRTLGLPAALATTTLAIRFRNERLDVDLFRHESGSTELLFSGGGRRPTLRELEKRTRRVGETWSLTDISRIGAFLLQDDFANLADHLAELPEETVIVLACSAEAEVLPWEWIIVEGMPLCLRFPVVRRSVGLSEKARGLRFVGQPLRALIIGDTGDESASFRSPLPGARKEIEEVKRVIEAESPGAVVTPLLGKEASYERVLREVERGDYDVIHFAGHAGCDESESFLMMNDGWVRSSELVSLLNRRPPAFMMLNSELTAFVPPMEGFSGGYAGKSRNAEWPLHPHARGFDRLAARAGVSAFIGVFRVGLEDEPAAKMATSTYRALLSGQPAALALLQARKECVQFHDVTGCFYSLSGHPNLRLAIPRATR